MPSTPESFSTLPIASCQQALEDLLRKELPNSDLSSLKIQAGSNKGDNYSCIIYRAQVKTGNKSTVSIIAKLPPQDETRRKQFFVRACFEREILMYSEVFPMMMEFQRSKGVDPNEGFSHIPTYLQGSLTDHEEAIFMRDLCEEKFVMVDRFRIMTVDECLLMIRTLARFHAISFALKDQQPERMKRFQQMSDILSLPEADQLMQTFYAQMGARALGLLDEKQEPEVYTKTKRLLALSWTELAKNLLAAEPAEPYAVIGQGDCWQNNLLYKYENGKPVDIRLLDWQCSRYGSPVLDLTYFIFLVTDKAFRDKYYEKLLSVYHTTLSEFVRRLGSDPERLFPWDAFQAQLLRFGHMGLVMATIGLPIITTRPEDVPGLEGWSKQVQDGEITEQSFGSKDLEAVYRKNMTDCCRDMVRLGYI
ncbi:uncharacterized protein LOC129732203 [Wyeomyia smithii]|uniref:uncharacterized protein LOC129732203 n=1 Tax=Wyeomyia smithii TaxID=174621 RepID=UPI002468050F|nr:uncharacterized protein LOC129732203 [Wyeomyia smithii]